MDAVKGEPFATTMMRVHETLPANVEVVLWTMTLQQLGRQQRDYHEFGPDCSETDVPTALPITKLSSLFAAASSRPRRCDRLATAHNDLWNLHQSLETEATPFSFLSIYAGKSSQNKSLMNSAIVQHFTHAAADGILNEMNQIRSVLRVCQRMK